MFQSKFGGRRKQSQGAKEGRDLNGRWKGKEKEEMIKYWGQERSPKKNHPECCDPVPKGHAYKWILAIT